MDGQLNGDAANASTIVANLSILIQRAMTSHEAHRTLPDGADPDRTDDRIAFYRTRVDALRLMREQFENEMARVAPY